MSAEPKAAAEPGIICKRCHCRHFHVVWTRPQKDKITRRRECRHCGWKVTTFERVSE